MTLVQNAAVPAADDTRLVLTRRFKAPRAVVYRAFADPQRLAQWWGPQGYSATIAAWDVRPGAKYRTGMTSPAGETHWVVGVFEDVVAEQRLAFSWAWDEGGTTGAETLVTIEFRDVPGGTEVVLTHERFATRDSRDQHEQGWTSTLVCLGDVLAAA